MGDTAAQHGQEARPAELELRLLGRFDVRVGGKTVDEPLWTRRKAKTLLKLLALEPSGQMHREQLAGILWPEVENAALAQNNLHKALHAARRALEPDLAAGAPSRFLLTQDQLIQLRAAGGLWVDSHEFERLAAQSSRESLDRAIALYGGELLPEDRYEDWGAIPRERLAKLFQTALVKLAALEEAGNATRATELLQRAIQSDPCNESAHRGLMRLYARQGQRHLAIAQFRQCEEQLRAELQVQPEPVTLQLYQEILAGGLAAAGGTPVPAAASAPPVESSSGPASAAPQPLPPDLPSTLAAAPPSAQRQTSRRFLAAAAISLPVLAAGGWLLRKEWLPRRVDSIAVLPIESVGDLDFVSDGVTEDLINRLSRLPGLRVMARSSVFSYKGRNVNPRKAGKEIGVPAVLSGRLAQAGPQLALDVELVDVDEGTHLWGRRYTFAPAQVALIQAQLASELAAALELRLKNEQQRRLARPDTPSAEAHRDYLMGRHYWNQRNEAGFRQAIRHFESALAKDPNYAAAYAGLADAYGLLGFSYASPRQYLPIARSMVSKALECDPDLAEAYTSLAMVKALYDWDWPGAEQAFRRSIELNPGYATAYHWYGVHLNGQGRHEEARAQLQKALELDPLSPIVQTNAAYPDHYQRRYLAAIAAYKKVLEVTPDFVVAHNDLQAAYEQTGRLVEARGEALLSRDQDLVEVARRLAGPVSTADYQAMIRGWRDRLVARSRREYVSPLKIAQASVRAGDTERAFEYLDQAVEERAAGLVYIRTDPMYDPIRPDRRFSKLIERVGLTKN